MDLKPIPGTRTQWGNAPWMGHNSTMQTPFASNVGRNKVFILTTRENIVKCA